VGGFELSEGFVSDRKVAGCIGVDQNQLLA